MLQLKIIMKVSPRRFNLFFNGHIIFGTLSSAIRHRILIIRFNQRWVTAHGIHTILWLQSHMIKTSLHKLSSAAVSQFAKTKN
jgi:hypothetical protein